MPANIRFPQPLQVLPIFRDEPMIAVFGMPYDQTENRWRLDQHETVISRCLGIARPQPTPFGVSRPSRTLQQYAAEFAQYRQVLDQAFLGQPGPYQPAAISRFVQQVRTQVAWASGATSSAAQAPPTPEAFARMTGQRQTVDASLSLLTAAERKRVTDYLSRRQFELAPAIMEAWFRDAAASPGNLASANAAARSYAGISGVLASLDARSRNEWEAKYKALLDSLIADPVAAEVAKLKGIPATLSGMLQLASWRAAFDSGFRAFTASPHVEDSLREYADARSRVSAGALPAWLKQAAVIPVDGAAITAKRAELETFFAAREDRSSPLFAQYDAPLKAKEDELRLRVDAETRKQQAEARAAVLRERNAAGASGNATGASVKVPKATPPDSTPVTPGSFTAAGLNLEKLFTNIFLGDFTTIDVDPEDLNFIAFYGQYLDAYARQCKRFLPENKVEITREDCQVERVVTNRYGVVSRSCATTVTVGTGLYADPQMYDAMTKLNALAAGDTLRNVAKMMSQRDLSSAMNMLNNVRAAVSDMPKLLQTNGCATPGTKRFQENLRRFALNKQPLRIGAASASSIIDPLPGMPFKDQDYTKLLDDLIAENSTSWVMNRYVRGSVAHAGVMSRDSRGRPAKIGAQYLYNGKIGGGVTLTFSDGVPECLYFNDMPFSCRTPNRKIVAAYANGTYR